MPIPLDEYPIHQAPVSLRYVPSSDRNFYDRNYFNAHDRTGDLFFISGCGVYPNLGVKDAFALIRKGERQWTIRTSDASDGRSLDQEIGPFRLEVITPLEELRLVCDTADSHGFGFDLTWQGSFPATDEQPHTMRTGPRAILEAQRFAQTGSWSGVIHVDGADIAVDPDIWLGTRDRSWGIRPVVEPETPGRGADEPLEGFWWLYVPLRFDDYQLIVICQEEANGFRFLNDATRVFADGRIEQLGWPRVEIRYQSGTRVPTGATIHLSTPTGEPLTLEVEPSGGVALNVGAGYGGDPEWGHGQWRGRNWVDSSVYDLTDPAVMGRMPFSVVDHVGRATCNGDVGYGLFEHGTFGRHDPSGFVDWGSVAP